mgnify:CR=1 FL=1
MTTKEIIENVQDLSFSHNRETVDVHVFDKEDSRLITARNISADLFLAHFDYGTTISDDREKNVEFLKLIL